MTEIFNNKNTDRAQLPLSVPISGSENINSNTLRYQASGTPGFRIKPLYENTEAKQRTWLMEIDAGASCQSHAHHELEQVYVISGSFYDEEHTYLPGEFVIRAPGAMHTAGSKGGAEVLLVYSKPS